MPDIISIGVKRIDRISTQRESAALIVTDANGKSINIKAEGDIIGGYGISAHVEDVSNGKIMIETAGDVSSTGDHSIGVIARSQAEKAEIKITIGSQDDPESGNITAKGIGISALPVKEESTASIKTTGNVTVTGDGGTGVHVSSDGIAVIETHDITAEAGKGIESYADSGGSAIVTADNVTAGTVGIDLSTNYNSTTEITVNGDVKGTDLWTVYIVRSMRMRRHCGGRAIRLCLQGSRRLFWQ